MFSSAGSLQLRIVSLRLKFLPNSNILASSKLKLIFAEIKLDVLHMVTSVLKMVENMVRYGDNVGYQHFLLFPSVFSRVIKTLYDCIVSLIRVNPLPNNKILDVTKLKAFADEN